MKVGDLVENTMTEREYRIVKIENGIATGQDHNGNTVQFLADDPAYEVRTK